MENVLDFPNPRGSHPGGGVPLLFRGDTAFLRGVFRLLLNPCPITMNSRGQNFSFLALGNALWRRYMAGNESCSDTRSVPAWRRVGAWLFWIAMILPNT